MCCCDGLPVLCCCAVGKSRVETGGLGLHRLVKQISELQAKNTELYQRALTSENLIEELKAEMETQQQSMSALQQERDGLQEDLIKARSVKVVSLRGRGS